MPKHPCCTMIHHEQWLHDPNHPEYPHLARRIEKQTQSWVARYGRAGLRTAVIRIPVVVHVIYHKGYQNIPDSHIHSQLRVLNKDYRRHNDDADQTPAAFRGVAADTRLEFALAVCDPDGRPTTGITRTKTWRSDWEYKSNLMKETRRGGLDPWDVDRYLNIWVVNYGDNTNGYGTRPPEPTKFQGVVCDYRAFGILGDNLSQGRTHGRTATHEIGHWLGLIHIWGRDNGDKAGGSCADSDNVADTPNQRNATARIAHPKFPVVSCKNGPNGNMFMNYMDYTNDKSRNMFTAGQVARMYATLYRQRAEILAAQALVPPINAPRDLWIKNGLEDVGREPEQSTEPMHTGDDIWVRTKDDGSLHPDHENPVYRPRESDSNYVYVRVRNRGTSDLGTGTLKLYWAKASTGLSWPSPWDGSVRKPALMGGLIGSKKVKVEPGGSEIVPFQWWPPNPRDYAAAGADQSSFSLLARIETSDGMTRRETGDLWANVRNNNNIAWKNVAIVDSGPGGGERLASVIVANFRAKSEKVSLFLQVPARESPTILDWGRVFVELPPGLAAVSVRPVDNNAFEVTKRQAQLGTFRLPPGAMHVLRIRLLPKPGFLGVHVLTWDLVQKVKGHVVGGQRFVIKIPSDHSKVRLDAPRNIFNGVKWVPDGRRRRKALRAP